MILYQCPTCYHTMSKAQFEFAWGLHPHEQHRQAECHHRRGHYEYYKEIDLDTAQTATIFTIGYSGKDMRQFLLALDARQVEMVIDTRWLPLSRHKPLFSKNNLRNMLAQRPDLQVAAEPRRRSIAYWHCRVLGSPPELRKRLHETNDYFTFFAEYHAHMIQQVEALRSVEALVADRQRVALLCSEASHAECHRSALATEIFRRLGGSPGLVHL